MPQSSSDRNETLGSFTDPAGNLFIIGVAAGDIPVTLGALQARPNSGRNAFVAKFSPEGKIVFATYLGGSGDDEAYGIAVDRHGSAYVVGVTDSADFPVVNGFQTGRAGKSDAFVAKLSPDGSRLEYSTYLGGMGNDWGIGVALDPSGGVYVSGATGSTNFPVTAGAIQPIYGGGPSDAFLTKIESSGSGTPRIANSTYLGGSGADAAMAMAADNIGDLYLAGFTRSTVLAGNMRGPRGQDNDTSDAFVVKLSAGVGSVGYVTRIGGSGDDLAFGIAVNPVGEAVIAGTTDSRDLDVSENAVQPRFGGLSDGFVTVIDRTGKGQIYTSYIGGRNYDSAESVTLDANGNAFVTGDFTGLPDEIASETERPWLGRSERVVVRLSIRQGK